MSLCYDVSGYPNKKENTLFSGKFFWNRVKTVSPKIGSKSAQMVTVWKVNSIN